MASKVLTTVDAARYISLKYLTLPIASVAVLTYGLSQQINDYQKKGGWLLLRRVKHKGFHRRGYMDKILCYIDWTN